MKKGVQNLYCQLFCENVPLRQSSDVLNELLLYDVGWRLSLFAQARPDEWVSGSRNFRVSHITRIPTHSCESHRMFQRLWMSAIMSDILHILMSPLPVAGSVPAVYLPLFTAHFIPKPSLHQPPGEQSTPGLWDMWRGMKKRREYNKHLMRSSYLRRKRNSCLMKYTI